jgi:Na+/melibiose symporter-like transporter
MFRQTLLIARFGVTTRRDYDRLITTRRILYWLAAMVVLLIVGTIVGVISADTSDVAGAFAVVTNIVGAVGIVLLLIALVVKRRRRLS